MGTLLASICNPPQHQMDRVLLLIDTATGAVEWRSLPRTQIVGTGLAQSTGLVFLACVSFEPDRPLPVSYVAVFAKPSLEYVDLLPLPGVHDPHSLLVEQSAFVVTSTGRDEVVRVGYAGGEARAEVLWRAAPDHRDQHHLNGLALFEGGLVCSGFGPRSGTRLSSATDGYIYDITHDTYLARGIFHPHSIVAHDRTLFYCESARRLVRRLDDATLPIGGFPGYVRGLAFAPDGACWVGTSVARKHSEMPEFVFNLADIEGDVAETTACTVCAVDPATRFVRSAPLDLTPLGAYEIYDVIWMS